MSPGMLAGRILGRTVRHLSSRHALRLWPAHAFKGGTPTATITHTMLGRTGAARQGRDAAGWGRRGETRPGERAGRAVRPRGCGKECRSSASLRGPAPRRRDSTNAVREQCRNRGPAPAAGAGCGGEVRCEPRREIPAQVGRADGSGSACPGRDHHSHAEDERYACRRGTRGGGRRLGGVVCGERGCAAEPSCVWSRHPPAPSWR